MLTSLTIKGLGPHEAFAAALHPRGVTVISGPSESGKSFITEAIFLAIWGRSTTGKFQVEAIRDGADQAEVELHLDSGRILRRTINRARQQQREIRLLEQVERFSSDAKFAEALGDLCDDEEVVRLIVAPLMWPPLTAANARKFRDVLSRVLPKGDVVGEVQRRVRQAGMACSAQEAQTDEKHLTKQRADARRAVDQERGRIQALTERLRELEAASGPSSAPEDAMLAERIAAWQDYDRKRDEAAASESLRGAQAVWDERRSKLGESPASVCLDEPTRAFQHAHRALEQARAEARRLTTRRRNLLTTFETAGPDHDPSICPTCLRPGWEEGSRAHQAAIEERKVLDHALAEATAAGLKLRAASEDAERMLEQARQAHAAYQRFQIALDALGPRPELPQGHDAMPPVAPTEPRPSADEIRAAASDAADRGASEQRARDLVRLREDHERAAAQLGQLEREAERLHVLVEAVRSAPSRVASQMVMALGDLGPVSFVFGDNPAVEVRIDGRPWWLASRGRLVVADAYLRAALRRVMEMEFLPLVIDNVQDVGGQDLPALAPPLIILRTNHGPKLSVEHAPSIAEAGSLL